MRLGGFVGLPLLVVVFGSGRAVGGDSEAEATLKEKGLTKAGRVFVVEEAELPVLTKMKEVRAAFASYATLADRQAMAETVAAQIAGLDEQKTQLQTNLDDLNQRINLQGNAGGFGRPGGMGGPQAAFGSSLIAQRDQVRNALATVDGEQKALKAQAGQAKDKAALEEDVQKKGEAFKAALAEVRPMVDEVTKKYTDLAADASVKEAMDGVKGASKLKLRLGPSGAFLAASRELDAAERRFLSKKSAAAPRKKGKSRK